MPLKGNHNEIAQGFQKRDDVTNFLMGRIIYTKVSIDLPVLFQGCDHHILDILWVKDVIDFFPPDFLDVFHNDALMVL